MSDEIHPYLVYRRSGEQLEFALWQLREGPQAAALFLTKASADAYRAAAGLGPEWRVLRPGKDDLWQLLHECGRAGIRHAVLDPDCKKAQRLFDLNGIIGSQKRNLYHLVPWEFLKQQPQDAPYRAASLVSEGFIHCSYRDQVERVANQFYAAEQELDVLVIDADRLASPVREEDAGTGELFPHVYGPINRSAILSVVPMEHDRDGRWRWLGVIGGPQTSR